MKENLDKIAVKGSVNIDGIKVETYKTEFASCNIIEVEVGTTGYEGGDTSHGGRTYMRIRNCSSTDMRCRVQANGKQYEFDGACEAGEVELIFGGDCEMETFYEALQFAAKVIGEHTGGLKDYEPTRLEIRQMTFAAYLNDLCKHYRRSGSLKGMGKIQSKHHVTPVTQQQFFECDLHHATGYIGQDFCDKVYAYILDNTKATPAPKYSDE